MKIVVAGAEQIGRHLAKMLSEDGHSVVVIDSDQKSLDDIDDIADVITIWGEATTFAVLKNASVPKADLYISIAEQEGVNIISAMMAKQLGAKKAIARIDNIEYLEQINKEMFINMGIDYLLNPELIVAQRVVELLGHTSTSEYVTFANGKLALVAYKLTETSPLLDKKLTDIAVDLTNLQYRTVAITRDGETIIPRGDDQFRLGDEVYTITNRESVRKVMEYSGLESVDVKKMMILGGSRAGIHVAKELQNQIEIKLVEYNQEKAIKIAEKLENTLVLYDDGRDIESMLEEGLSSMDAFVAVTGRSETNILAAMVAKKLGVKRVIAEVENINYINMAQSMGVDTIVNKKSLMASAIFKFTTSTDVYEIKGLTGSDAEVLEFIVKPDSPATKNIVKDLDFPPEAIIGGIVRGAKVFIAVGDSQIMAYDRVVVFSLPSALERVGRFFNRV